MFQGMDYIYAVYEEGSFSKAARKLFISQPSLSASVKRVEQKVGYPLFDRSTKPLSLTECGEKYIRSVEEIRSIQNGFSAFVNDLGSLKTGQLILGGSSMYSSGMLPPLMGEFTKRFPLVRLELIEERTAELACLLQNGTIDLMMDNCLLDEEIFNRHLFSKEQLLLAVPETLPVNQTALAYQVPMKRIRDGSFLEKDLPPVPLSLFSNAPFVLLKPENDTRKRAITILQEHNITPNIVFELDQQLTSYHIAASGLGIAFLSNTLITRVPEHPGLIFYKLDSPSCSRNIYFHWKKGRYVSKAMEEFLKIACKTYSEDRSQAIIL